MTGRRALVCAASKGLGRGCAEALAREGVDVTICARTAADVERAGGRDRRVGGPTRRVGRVRHHDGGRSRSGARRRVRSPISSSTTPAVRRAGDFRDWDRAPGSVRSTRTCSTPIELIKATVDAMIARRFGRIVNITSSAVKAPIDVLGLSNGARSGLTGFVAGLARKVARHNVTINNLLPGPFDTDRLRTAFDARALSSGRPVAEIRNAAMDATPAGRFGDPREFGAICAFLCSVHAGYIAGQNILVDGAGYPGTF